MKMQTLVTALGFALMGAAAQAQTVTYDFDKNTDFSKIKTYAWARGQEIPDDFNHKRIVSAIDSQLAAKGLTKIEGETTPDVYVAYGAGFERNLQINGSSSDFGGPFYRGNRTGSARTEEVVTGTLVVGMIDVKTNAVVWRGAASRDLDPKASPEKKDKNINKAVSKMFEKYPPKAKGD